LGAVGKVAKLKVGGAGGVSADARIRA